MATSLDCAGLATIVYSAGTSTVRYLYIRSSFEINIERVLKRDSFILQSVVIGEGLNFLTLVSHYMQPTSSDYGLSPLLLYHACIKPEGNYTFPPYTVFPLMLIVIIGSACTNITCSFLLFRYLQNITENTIARSEVDKKKDRKRNLVPARIGMMIIAWTVSYTLLVLIIYMLPLKYLDNSYRAFINANYSDFSQCIIAPLIMINGSKEGSRKVSKMFNSLFEVIRSNLAFTSRTIQRPLNSAANSSVRRNIVGDTRKGRSIAPVEI